MVYLNPDLGCKPLLGKQYRTPNMKTINNCLFIEIILFTGFLSACERKTSGIVKSKAEKGVLNSTNWDFGQEGSVILSRKWEFY